MGYTIQALDAQTWLIEEEGECNVYLYLLAGERQAIVLDTGYGTIPLDRIVAELTSLPVSVLCTHGHFDHTGGNGYFSPVRLHRADRGLYPTQLAEPAGCIPNAIAPEITEEPLWFDGGFTLDLGGRTLEVICTPGHTKGSVVVLDVQRRWLFTGDTCCKGAVLLHFDHSDSIEAYRDSLRGILSLRDRFDTTWPSHHAYPVDTSVLEQFVTACDLILNGAAQAKSQDAASSLFSYGDIEVVYRTEDI